MHRVTLRDEHLGADHRHLEAYLDERGDLHLDGHDLGPGTGPVSGDGEYEWFQVIRAAHLPRLREVLELEPHLPLLEALRARYSGPGSYELERRLRERGLPVERTAW